MKYLPIYFAFLLFITGCNVITGNGNIKEENRSVPDFKSVYSSGSIDVEVTQGNGLNVTVINDENLLPYMITEVKDGELQIHYKKNTNISNSHAKVVVTAPDFKNIRTSGSGDISANGMITSSETINISSSGSGDVSLNVDAPALIVKGSGSGDYRLSGRTRDLSCKISGSGDVDSRNLLAENVSVRSAGSGDFKVFASVSLKVSISGSGNVLYWGNPSVSDVKINGSGKLRAGE